MLDLKNMSDSEFCDVVKPPVKRAAMQVTLDKAGNVSLSGKPAEQLSGKPVEIRFNKARTAIQIVCLPEYMKNGSIMFPKNGRKTIPNAAELVKQVSVSFPVVFSSYDIPENGKWRGARQENPTTKPSRSSRSTKQK